MLDRIDERAIDELLARDEFFWLDLVDPTDEQLAGLGERFGWHPLALVRREIEPGAEIAAGAASATVVELPF